MHPTPPRSALLRRLSAIQRALCCLFIAAIAILVASEVIVRSAFAVTLGFAHEISNYLLVATAFLGFGVALADDRLFRIDMIHARLPVAPQRVLQLFFDVLSLAFSLVIAWYLARFVMSSFVSETRSSTSLGVRLFIPQATMPLGFAFVSLTLLVRIWQGLVALLRPESA